MPVHAHGFANTKPDLPSDPTRISWATRAATATAHRTCAPARIPSPKARTLGAVVCAHRQLTERQARAQFTDRTAIAQSPHIHLGNVGLICARTTPSTRDQIAADLKQEEQRLEQHLRRLAAPMLMISNGEDTVTQLRKLLGVPMR